MNFPKLRLMLCGGIMVLTAGWLLISALGTFFHTMSFVKSATKVEGIIGRLVDGQSPSIHYPMYFFKDADGNWHRTDTDLDHPTNHKEEDKVPLLYPPDHPHLAVLGTFWALWKWPVVKGGLGLLDLLLGLGVLWYAKSQ